MTIHQPTAAVRESFGQAQKQAAAMVAGPPAPWQQATPAHRRAPFWLGLAAASIAAGGVTAWLGLAWLGDPAQPPMPQAQGGSQGPNASVTAPAPSPAPVTAPWPTTAQPPATPALAAPTSLSVTRRAGVIRIASTGAPLAEVVRALAGATNTRVQGGEALASISSPVTLTWQGKDTAAAWDAVLGRNASIAVSCSGANCDLWIVGVNAPRAAGGSTADAVEATGPAQAPRPAVQAPPPQNADENTETN